MKNPNKQTDYKKLEPHVGERLKYWEICKILGEETCKGNKKVAQLRRWREHFDYDKIGIYFDILGVFDEEIANMFREGWSKYIYLWLLVTLQNTSREKSDNGETAEILSSINDIMLDSGVISQRLLDGYYDYDCIKLELNRFLYNKDFVNKDLYYATKYQSKVFAKTVYDMLKSSIKYALENISENYLIVVSKAYVAETTPDENGVTTLLKYTDRQDVTKCTNAKRDAMDSLGMKTMRDFYLLDNDERRKFSDKFSDNMGEMFNEPIQSVWEKYYITMVAPESFDFMIKETEKELQCSLRDKVRTRLNSSSMLNNMLGSRTNDLVDFFLPEIRNI